jgi:uncharacterized membrane protein YjfL (UPF0719 family)
MKYQNEKTIDYLTLAVSIATASALVGNFIITRKHLKEQASHLEAQKELTKLEIAQKKKEMNFRNFTEIPDITKIIPNQQSQTTDWCSFYSTLKSRYGKNTAEVLFAKTWQLRKGQNVNTNDVIRCTGLTLNTTWIENTSSTARDIKEGVFGTIKGAVDFGSTTTKIVVWGGIGIAFLLIGTFVYKAVTFKPREWEGLAGSVSKGAASALTKKGM